MLFLARRVEAGGRPNVREFLVVDAELFEKGEGGRRAQPRA